MSRNDTVHLMQGASGYRYASRVYPEPEPATVDRQRSVIVLPVTESNGYTVGLDASACIVLERVHADGTATRVTVTDVEGLVIALRRASVVKGEK